MFLQAIAANDALSKTDRFTQYTAFVELAISGGTLRDGLCYIVPFKGKAQFLPGWKFRLEQINEIPDVVYCHEPQVVYDCDTFEYELGERPKILRHAPGKRTKESRPTHVYFVIDFTHGPQVYIMDAVQVLAIRDQYSKSYQDYAKACAEIKQDPALGKPVSREGKFGKYDVELPMWVKDEKQAFQKTIVKQTWKHLPKLPKHKWLDQKQQAQGTQELEAEDFDNLVLKQDAPPVQQQQPTEYTEAEDMGEQANVYDQGF